MPYQGPGQRHTPGVLCCFGGFSCVVAGGRGKGRSRKEKKPEFAWTSPVELGVLDPADDSVARHHVMTDHITRGLAFDEMDQARVVEVEETFARARVSVAVSKNPTSMSRGVLLWYPPHYGLRVVALRFRWCPRLWCLLVFAGQRRTRRICRELVIWIDKFSSRD